MIPDAWLYSTWHAVHPYMQDDPLNSDGGNVAASAAPGGAIAAPKKKIDAKDSFLAVPQA